MINLYWKFSWSLFNKFKLKILLKDEYHLNQNDFLINGDDMDMNHRTS